MKSRILICNDDGIYSPGVASLAKVASRFGDVRIVAPDVEQSSMGHATTSLRPLRYRRTPLPGGFEAYRVNGTPADCVALAPIYGSGLILFFPGSISGRILAALAGTRARSLPQNKLRCSDYAVSLLAPLSVLPRKHLTSVNWNHTSRKCLSFFSKRKSCAW